MSGIYGFMIGASSPRKKKKQKEKKKISNIVSLRLFIADRGSVVIRSSSSTRNPHTCWCLVCDFEDFKTINLFYANNDLVVSFS